MSSILDFDIDERCSLIVYINTKRPNGIKRDITGASVEWEADHMGLEMVTKSTATATIILSPPDGDGEIVQFSFTLLPDDTDLAALETTYGVPVVYHHEARVTLATQEFIAVRGRMFVWPSET